MSYDTIYTETVMRDIMFMKTLMQHMDIPIINMINMTHGHTQYKHVKYDI